MDSTDQLRDFYEKNYARSTAVTAVPLDDNFMYAQVLGQVRPYLRPGLKVLDLGCNDGNLSLYMARAGCEVLGIDLARNAVDTARRSAQAHGIANARFEALDFLQDWREAQAFDFVLCSHVIEHVPQDGEFVQKIFSALKPGGRLVLLTPSQYSSLARASRFFTGRFRHDEDVGHLRRYTRASCEATVRGAGFEIDKCVFLDGMLRDWFILCRPLRVFNRIWSLPIIRTVFNAADRMSARFLFPAAICIHARRPGDPHA